MIMSTGVFIIFGFVGSFISRDKGFVFFGRADERTLIDLM